MALTVDDLKKLTALQKVLLVLGIYLLLGYFFYFYVASPGLEQREALTLNASELDKQLLHKQRIAVQKKRFLQEIASLEEAFALAATKLPNEKEIPNLLLSVETAGRASGIQFVLFEPRPPVAMGVEAKPSVKDSLKPSDQRADQKPAAGPAAGKARVAPPEKFYEEIPIQVTIHGGFNDTLGFFEKVAHLPRIVLVREIVMGDGRDVKGRGRLLTTHCLMKTFTFLRKTDEIAKKAEATK